MRRFGVLALSLFSIFLFSCTQTDSTELISVKELAERATLDNSIDSEEGLLLAQRCMGTYAFFGNLAFESSDEADKAYSDKWFQAQSIAYDIGENYYNDLTSKKDREYHRISNKYLASILKKYEENSIGLSAEIRNSVKLRKFENFPYEKYILFEDSKNCNDFIEYSTGVKIEY